MNVATNSRINTRSFLHHTSGSQLEATSFRVIYLEKISVVKRVVVATRCHPSVGRVEVVAHIRGQLQRFHATQRRVLAHRESRDIVVVGRRARVFMCVGGQLVGSRVGFASLSVACIQQPELQCTECQGPSRHETAEKKYSYTHKYNE